MTCHPDTTWYTIITSHPSMACHPVMTCHQGMTCMFQIPTARCPLLFKGMCTPFPMDVYPFSAGCEFQIPTAGCPLLFKGMCTPFQMDVYPFSAGCELLFEGAPLLLGMCINILIWPDRGVALKFASGLARRSRFE